MSDAHGNELYPPGNGIWFVLVPVPPESGGASTDFMGSQYIDSDKAATQDPSTENAENTENAVATQDPYMIMQRMHHPRPQVSDPTDSKKKKKGDFLDQENETGRAALSSDRGSRPRLSASCPNTHKY